MITIYTKNNCMQCKFTKKWLDEHGLKGRYTTKNLDQDPSAEQEVRALGFMSLPVVVAHGVAPFSGFRPDELVKVKAAFDD